MDKEWLDDRDDHNRKDKDKDNREVSDIGGAVPFVKFFRYTARVEDTWPEEELLIETAARVSREERSEMVRSGQRRSSW